MKVYVITYGEYYRIEDVFIDKNAAERKCALLNDSSPFSCYKVEKYEADETKIEANKELNQFFIMEVYYDSGEIYEFHREHLTFGDEGRLMEFIYPSDDSKPMIRAELPLSKDTTDEQAKKIMLDRIAKFKAERAGIV